MISKKNKFSYLGAVLVKSKHVQQFCEGLHIFCPDFHEIKTFGAAVTPPAPPPSTSVN